METPEKKVFISYAWGTEREEIVNKIVASLQKRGINIIRDKSNLGYRGSIQEFMKRIGRGTCIIVVVSDKYLKSPNCMFELVEIAGNKRFRDRIFPIILPDADIYDPLRRLEYVKYWEEKRAELGKAINTVDPAHLQGIREDIDNYDRFRDEISELATTLKDMNALTPEMHQDSDFHELYEAIDKQINRQTSDQPSNRRRRQSVQLSPRRIGNVIRLKKLEGVGPDIFESNDSLITFGRGKHNLVIIDHKQISVEHGQLILQEGVYRYRHLSRSNITTIESLVKQSVEIVRAGDTSAYPLFNKDRLVFGNRVAVYVVSYNVADDEVYVPTERAPQ